MTENNPTGQKPKWVFGHTNPVPSPQSPDFAVGDVKSRQRYAFRTSLIFGLGTLGIFIFGFIDALPIPNWMSAVTLFSSLILAVTGLYAAFANRKEYNPRAVLVLIVVFWVGSLVIVAMTSGLGLILAIAVFTLSTSLSIQALPIRQVNYSILVATVVAGAVFLAELFIGYERDVASPDIVNVLPWVVGGIALIFLFFIIQRFEQFPLLTKIVVPFVAILTTAVGFLAVVNYFSIRDALTNASNEKLRSAALQTATQVDSYFDGILNGLSIEASLPVFVDYISLQPQERAGTPQERQAQNLLFSLQGRGFILSYSIFDTRGQVILSTLATDPAKLAKLPISLNLNQTDRGFLQIALLSSRGYISPVIYDPANSQPTIYFVKAINNHNGVSAGVLVSRYNLRTIQTAIFEQEAGLAGEGSFPELVDNQGLRLASGLGVDGLDKLIAPLSAEESQRLVDEGRLPRRSLDLLATNLPGYQAQLDLLDTQLAMQAPAIGQNVRPNAMSLSFETEEEGIPGLLYAVAVPLSSQKGWKVTFMQPQSILLAPINENVRNTSLLLLGIIGVSIAAAALIAQAIARPVIRLTGIAQIVQQGDLNVNVPVRSEDEIGLLSLVFNDMTAQLRQTLTSLEQRVVERTEELALTSKQAEGRAAQLETIADIARAVATERDPDQLLPLITRTISERFGFYHVGIFLVDKEKEYAVLRAANSEGGQRMLARRHQLKVGQQGIVGFVTSQGQPRVALDVGQDAVFFNNPDLPQTRSEIGLPLKVGETTIGALDVQSVQPSAFHDEDVAILATLADQVAIAIENARLFQSTNQALDELQAVQRQYLRERWLSRTEGKLTPGFVYEHGQVKPMEILDKQQASATPLSVPINLRGEVIGTIDLQKMHTDTHVEHVWTEEEMKLASAVAEQVGLALENARLIEETQQRAEREALVAQITNRLRASNDPQLILQTAVVELKQALRARTAHVVVPGHPGFEPADQNTGAQKIGQESVEPMNKDLG